MDSLGNAIAAAANELKKPGEMEARLKALQQAEPDLGFLVLNFAAGLAGTRQAEVRQHAKEVKSAVELNAITQDMAGNGFLKGLVFGLMAAQNYGFHFEQTPDGVKLIEPGEGLSSTC